MIVFLNKIDVLDAKIRHGLRIDFLASFASSWMNYHELKKSGALRTSFNDITEMSVIQRDLCTTNNTSNGREPLSEHSEPPTNQRSTANKEPPITSTPIFRTRTFRQLSRRHAPNSIPNADASTPHRAPKSLTYFSPMNSVRRIRNSFRMALSSPIRYGQSTYGQSSRDSCTASVTKIILSSPYDQFTPTGKSLPVLAMSALAVLYRVV